MRGIPRPKRQPRDDIHVCNCQAPKGSFGALPARQPTQRQANSTLHKQMLLKAAATAAATVSAATVPSPPAAATASPQAAVDAVLPQSIDTPNPAADAAQQATPVSGQSGMGMADAASSEGASHATASPSDGSPAVSAVLAQALGCGEDCLNRLSFIHCDPKLCCLTCWS